LVVRKKITRALPVARSPYPEQQRTGALIVTLAVLGLSIFALVIASSRSASR
jgi:hypothetical protein